MLKIRALSSKVLECGLWIIEKKSLNYPQKILKEETYSLTSQIRRAVDRMAQNIPKPQFYNLTLDFKDL